MTPLPPYSQWLVDVACERPVGPQPPPPEIRDPANFLGAVLRILSLSPTPVTRRGLDSVMDAVFVLPQLTPLLENPAHHQQIVPIPPRFAAHWQHIVLPAWNQHAAIRWAINESADTVGAQNLPRDTMHTASPASPALLD